MKLISYVKYIHYLSEAIGFNYFYKCFYRSDISLFDNCSFAAFKRNTEEIHNGEEN